MRRDLKRYKSSYELYFENKDKPLWERQKIEQEYHRERLREMDEERRAYEQKKKAEREEKKRKAAEEQELIKQAEEAAAKVIEKEIKKMFQDMFK